MNQKRTTLVASVIVLVTGAFWGLYWIPVRMLAERGLDGAWGTAAITAAAVILLAPPVIARRQSLARAGPVTLISVALGGAAFALYSIGFVYGRVAIIILLYFLTPVWSTLIGRYVMGWRTTRLRLLAIASGLAGLAVMLGAQGQVPLPRGAGEWMALLAGMLWSVATTGIRAKAPMELLPAALVFASGAFVCSILLAPFLARAPGAAAEGSLLVPFAVALVTGALWWGLSVGGLIWAAARLEPARVGILLMTEVLFGAVSAALIAGERLHPTEIAGGLLVLLAGVLEVWPERRLRRKARR